MKKLLACVVIGGLCTLGCNPGTTKSTVRTGTGESTHERTSGGSHTGGAGMGDTEDKAPHGDTKVEVKVKPGDTKKETKKDK
jgi:hypothetical protein